MAYKFLDAWEARIVTALTSLPTVELSISSKPKPDCIVRMTKLAVKIQVASSACSAFRSQVVLSSPVLQVRQPRLEEKFATCWQNAAAVPSP